MRRFAYWLFPLIAGAVAVFIVVLLIRINPSTPPIDAETIQEDDNGSVDSTDTKGSWIDRFSMSEDSGTVYPINEVSLELDMGEEKSSLDRYRLSVPLQNSYELFCLKQELKNSGFSYFFQKEGDAMTLLVDSDDRNKLASLVTKLKTYQITATVSPYTEEK